MTNCEICRVLTSDEDQEVILSTEYWRVTLAPDQAFQEDEPSPHVHLKARPRHKTPPTLNGTEYPDHEFGRRHGYTERRVSAGELRLIANKLRAS